MNLKDTIEPMLSLNYKERFKAEYWQLSIRHDKLEAMLKKYNNGTLDFKPTCPIDVLDEQLAVMDNLLQVLRLRASIEHIDLDV